MLKKLWLFAVFIAVAGVLLSHWAKLDSPLPVGAIADRVLIEKHERRLTLFGNGAIIKAYRISLGRHPEGKKTQEGDGRTPEGTTR